jgi:hypothetical protein
MQRLTPSRSLFAGSALRTLAALGLAAGLCSIAYVPLRAAAVDTPAVQNVVQIHLAVAPTTAAEALPSLPQRLIGWLYSVQRSVEQSTVSSSLNDR